MTIACHLAFWCILCKLSANKLQHIFFDCRSSRNLWHMYCKTSIINVRPSHHHDLWSIGSRESRQVNIIRSALIFLLNSIWYARNTARYMNFFLPTSTIISCIKTQVITTINNSLLVAHSSMDDFTLLKAFDIKINYTKVPTIEKVIWQPSNMDWIKCNSDDAFIHKILTSDVEVSLETIMVILFGLSRRILVVPLPFKLSFFEW